MVAAPAAAEAVAIARRLPGLHVGLHLVLVDGRPALPANEIPLLVGRDGRFRDDMAAAGARMFFDSRARRQLAAEIEAQFQAFAHTGLALDHVNAHKHFHLHPTIAGLIVRIGHRFGLKAARVPAEPRRVLTRIELGARGSAWLGPWLALMRARFRRAGLATNDNVFGLVWSGAMTEARLLGIVENLPDGVSEIYCHPATDDKDGPPGYRHVTELAALTSPVVRARLAALGLKPVGFADLAARPNAGALS